MTNNSGQHLLIVALGGNAIISSQDAGRIEEQFQRTAVTVKHLAEMIRQRIPLVITHGNGPIVGNIVVRNEAAEDTIPPMPLDVCGADSQGGIGYMLQQTLRNELVRQGIRREVVTVVTQVVVDPHDPAFRQPTKPIGPFYSRDEGERMERDKGWVVKEDAGRGYRRVVPSPLPRAIVEIDVVRRLVEAGVVVIAVGGGGIPVVRTAEGGLEGVEAVVDKDLASAVLARDLDAHRMMILTAVPAVYRNFGKPDQEEISYMDVGEAKRLLEEGQFPPGSMAPKIQSAVNFLTWGGEEVLIALPEMVREALDGRSGTRIGRGTE